MFVLTYDLILLFITLYYFSKAVRSLQRIAAALIARRRKLERASR